MAAPSRVLVVGGGVIGTLRWECCAVNVVRIVRCLRTLTFGVLPMVCGFAFLPSSWLWCDVVVRVSEMTSRSGTKRPSPPVVPTKLSPNLLWNCILILVYSIPSCVHKLYWILMMGCRNKQQRSADRRWIGPTAHPRRRPCTGPSRSGYKDELFARCRRYMGSRGADLLCRSTAQTVVDGGTYYIIYENNEHYYAYYLLSLLLIMITMIRKEIHHFIPFSSHTTKQKHNTTLHNLIRRWRNCIPSPRRRTIRWPNYGIVCR